MKLRAIILFLIITLHAQDSTPGKALNDPLLDKLVGDWTVERTMANGHAEKNTVQGEWMLQHQFVELHYRDAAALPKYEAILLIGYDDIGKRYLCYWSDTFGGSYSTDGFAPRDEWSNAIEFRFEYHDGPLTNRFAFDPQTQQWKSTIRQAEKGEWKLFCEDKFTRTGRGSVKP